MTRATAAAAVATRRGEREREDERGASVVVVFFFTSENLPSLLLFFSSSFDSFDANPSSAFNDEYDDDESYVATAEDVAAWQAGLCPPPQPRFRELRYADSDGGGSYRGETLGGLRHGLGTLSCSNGDRYEGNWRLGLRQGKGRAMFPSRGTEQGEVGYEGEWVDDKAEG
jgi:hypothetical protein